MTTKDRILCALGFHGKMEETPGRIMRRSDDTVVGTVLRCSICGRFKSWRGA